jgi:mannitol/fructose-specific phosphotransferase system IIA component (Ntr-type)
MSALDAPGTAAAAVSLQGLVDPRLVFLDVPGDTAAAALEALADRLAGSGVVTDAGDLARRLIEREKLGCTAVGGGVAIPHTKSKNVDDLRLAVATLRPGADFCAPDGVPVSIVFLVISPAQSPALHLQALARISRLLRTPGFRERLLAAKTAEEIVSILCDADAAPTGEFPIRSRA